MPGPGERLVAGLLFGVYIAVNLVLFVAIPLAGIWDWNHWGSPVIRDALAVAAALAIGFPLLAAAAGIKPS